MKQHEQLINLSKRLLLGPYEGENEQLTYSPLDLYTTGILYPQITSPFMEVHDNNQIDNPSIKEYGLHENEKETFKQGEASISNMDNQFDDELGLATNFRPSSCGLTAIVNSGSKITITIKFARYREHKNDGKKIWKREGFLHSLSLVLEKDNIDFAGKIYRKRISETIDEENIELHIYSRSFDKNQCLVTITIINKNRVENYLKQKSPRLAFFQPEINLESPDGFLPFPEKKTITELASEDEKNSSLLYREYKNYASGHGISVDWKQNELGSVNNISTQVLPIETIKGVDVDLNDRIPSEILEMKNLSYNNSSLVYNLKNFAQKYKDWIEHQRVALKGLKLNSVLFDQAESNLENCSKLHARMIKGIELVQSNSQISKAFCDANQAMFMQRVMSSFSKWRKKNKVNIPNTDNYKEHALPYWEDIPVFRKESDNEFGVFAKWRPFQLAFILSQIEGIIDPKCEDRDTTDLIWFPTGGGKTEAYLGLTAFTIFFRRLSKQSKGYGVSIFMRYTLRMLNLQQFNRASILIAACEIIRSKDSSYGEERISTGLWVGKSLTPNKKIDFNKSIKIYKERIENGKHERNEYSPPLFNCPCCGNRLVKDRVTEKSGIHIVGEWGYRNKLKKKELKGKGTGDIFISCTNSLCHFHVQDKVIMNGESDPDNCFPFYNIDEVIYEKRPTLLFGTTDKFAQLSWEPNSYKLFNLEFETGIIKRLFDSPDLIIQDELHLINSSLGTVYSLFEFAIDYFSSHDGNKPKIVAATATVKNAKTQCERLYNRKHFLQFPPPGLSADDSFYMRKNNSDATPRTYIGYMPSGFTSSTSIIRLSSILVESTNLLSGSNSEIDDYYTLLIYFNALKELGKFRTYIEDDIRAYRKFLTAKVTNSAYQSLENRDIEISSALSADEIALALERLERKSVGDGPNQDNVSAKQLHNLGLRSLWDWFQTSQRKRLVTKELFKKLDLEFDENNQNINYERLQIFISNSLGDDIDSMKDSVKIACATNMIATGVDIDRLNVMIINGHPKSTSEYIQASSRVGRRNAGLIFSFYSPTKNRDRSYYENFKSFHQAYYKGVEPTSVTPGALPALEKVLPSILIALSRAFHFNASKEEVKFDSLLENFLNNIVEEVCIRFNIHHEIVKPIIYELKRKWSSFIPEKRRFSNFNDFFDYNGPHLNKIHEVLSIPPQYSDILPNHIPVLQTLRTVEGSSNVNIKLFNQTE